MHKSDTHTQLKENTPKIIFHSLVILIAVYIILISILCLVPPTSRDALIHHLQIPKLYLQHGGIYEIPALKFSYYPMNLDLLYLWALSFGNDILPKYIHMLFGFGTALLLYWYIKKRLSKTYALLGSLFFLSIPIIVKLSVTIYVDLGLIFFSTAALLSLFHWIEGGKKKYNALILAGICCGLAIGTKYNGLLVLFLLTLFIPLLVLRSTKNRKKSSRKAMQAAALFFLTALLIASPWLIRNTIWTGNPFYPLYDSVFNPQAVTAAVESSTDNAIRGVFATRHILYGENLGQLLLLPVRIFFEGADDNPQFFDGRLNPFLLILPLLAFFQRSTATSQVKLEKITLAAFCILYFLFAFNIGVLRIRYLTPMVPFLVILSMYGLHNVQVLTKKYFTSQSATYIAILIPVTIMLSGNAAYIFKQFKSISPFSYISGQLSRDDYLYKYRPEYKVMQYANTHLPESAKILCIFMGWRGYYLNKQHVFDYHSNHDLLLSWIKEPDITIVTVLKRLQKKNISHILLREDLTIQWTQHLSTSQQRVWAMLTQKHLSVLTSYSGYTLFQILPSLNESLLSHEQAD